MAQTYIPTIPEKTRRRIQELEDMVKMLQREMDPQYRAPIQPTRKEILLAAHCFAALLLLAI